MGLSVVWRLIAAGACREAVGRLGRLSLADALSAATSTDLCWAAYGSGSGDSGDGYGYGSGSGDSGGGYGDGYGYGSGSCDSGGGYGDGYGYDGDDGYDGYDGDSGGGYGDGDGDGSGDSGGGYGDSYGGSGPLALTLAGVRQEPKRIRAGLAETAAQEIARRKGLGGPWG